MARIRVKRTKSKATMKRLLRKGWELQGVEGKSAIYGTTLGTGAYILVKKPPSSTSVSVHVTNNVAATAITSSPPGPPVVHPNAELRIGVRVVVDALGFRGKTGVIVKMSERNLSVRLDEGTTARMVPHTKVRVIQ